MLAKADWVLLMRRVMSSARLASLCRSGSDEPSYADVVDVWNFVSIVSSRMSSWSYLSPSRSLNSSAKLQTSISEGSSPVAQITSMCA